MVIDSAKHFINSKTGEDHARSQTTPRPFGSIAVNDLTVTRKVITRTVRSASDGDTSDTGSLTALIAAKLAS